MAGFLTLQPSLRAPASDLPVLAEGEWREAVLQQAEAGARLGALFGSRADGSPRTRLVAVLLDPRDSLLKLAACDVEKSFQALTPDLPAAHLFEREIHESCGVHPVGHEWLKGVRFPPRREGGAALAPELKPVYRVEGEAVHEVAVGPVHAGVIEPGHFRFQCHGERVLHLEIMLGYQHRGIERALVGGPNARTLHLMETLAGDTTVGHATAHCEAVEGLSGIAAPPRAQALRALALELERLANHVGDLGALANDIGYLPTSSACGRLRGDFLNMTAALCGSRFGRSFVRPGGVGFDADEPLRRDLSARLPRAMAHVREAVDLLWSRSSVMARFEGVGALEASVAEEIGLVGPAARACGIPRDVRAEFPSGMYRFVHVPISTASTGDVLARALVRWLEVQRSAAFVEEALPSPPAGPTLAKLGALAPDSVVATLGEGWRGEIVHVALTDARGRFSRYCAVDPSFKNWTGLALAMRNQQISDFPLCNKSFNLSYCGTDS